MKRTLLALLQPRILRRLLLGVGCGLTAWLLSLLGPLRALDDWFGDCWFRLWGARPTQARVILVTLEDVDLDRLDGPAIYLSPALAEVVTSLNQQGAKAIGLDLIIPETLSGRPELAAGGPGDATQLGAAIQQAGNVVLAKRLLPDGRWLLPLLPWQFKAHTDPDPRGTDLAFVDLTPAADHVVRCQQLLDPEGNLHFALALYLVASGAEIEWRPGLWLRGRPVPLDAAQRLRIAYAGPPGTFPRIPFADAWDAARKGRPQRLDVRDAIVIIGVTGPSQQDVHATPYAGLMSGPELHAHILATLIDEAYLTTPPWLAPLPLACLWGAVLALALPWLHWQRGTVVLAGSVLVWGILAALGVRHAHWRIDIVPLVAAGFLVYTATFRPRWGRPKHQPPDHSEPPPSRAPNYPAPIAIAYGRFLGEENPASRLEALFSAVEATMRYLVTVGVSDLLHCLVEKGAGANLPTHTDFDLLRSPQKMVMGRWCGALRETARALDGEPHRFLQEFPEVCKPGGRLDGELLAELIKQRNRIHADASIYRSPDQCQRIERELRPRLEEMLQEIGFLCHYPLGFVQAQGEPAGGAARQVYGLHSCMGEQVQNPATEFIGSTACTLVEGIPFIVAPGGDRLLFLWPLLGQRVSRLTRRPALYVFEGIATRRGAYLTEIQSAAIDTGEEWFQVLQETPADSHAWLLTRLRELPQLLEVPRELRLGERLQQGFVK